MAKKKTSAKKAAPKPVSPEIASMLRVNHAGEYGAKRIYQAQLDVLGHAPKLRKLIEHMAEQERHHLEYFEKEIVRRRARPSALHPLWHVAGYAVGAITARMGVKAAMACTVAVEHAISGHYQEQLDALKDNQSEKELRSKIARFKAEEEEHHDIGIDHDAEQTPGYKLLYTLINRGSKLAIEIAKRV
jgi:ubiquinone biosynthesis monooxygenase Coq7